MMNIAVCADDKYVIPALVCLVSVFENNKDSQEINVYVLTESLSDLAHLKFKKLGEVYGRSIEIVTVNLDKYNGLTETIFYSKAMYLRFLLPYVLENVNYVLYLDCDTMIRHSLTTLWNVSQNDSFCSVVVDQECDDVLLRNRVGMTQDYFNSGVLVINLALWRKERITERLFDYLASHSGCLYPDQDALNFVLDGKVKYLSPTYNYQHRWVVDLNQCRIANSRKSRILAEGKDPCIVHFCNAKKPWHRDCDNNFKEEYLIYAQLHGFIEFRFTTRHSLLLRALNNCTVLINFLKFRLADNK